MLQKNYIGKKERVSLGKDLGKNSNLLNLRLESLHQTPCSPQRSINKNYQFACEKGGQFSLDVLSFLLLGQVSDPFLYKECHPVSLRRLMQVLNESDLFFLHWPGLAEEMNCCRFFAQRNAALTRITKLNWRFPHINSSVIATTRSILFWQLLLQETEFQTGSKSRVVSYKYMKDVTFMEI